MHLSLIIGSFQPFHRGHLSVVSTAIESSDHTIVFIDRSNCLNTFSFYRVVDMISLSLSTDQRSKVTLMPLPEFNDLGETKDFIDKTLIGYFGEQVQTTYYTGNTTSKYSELMKSSKVVSDIVDIDRVPIETTHINHLLFNVKLDPKSMTELPRGTQEVIAEFYK